MELLKAFLTAMAIILISQAATAQGMSGSLHPYWDEAETVPYFEEYGAEEESTYIESTCDRYEVPIGEEAAYLESITPVPCNETFEGCTDGGDDDQGVLDSTGTGPGYYNKHPHTCDWHLPNWVSIRSGPHQNAGTNADIWMCFGRHMEHYHPYPAPDYDRPETLWYDDTPEGQDAACFNLGPGPSAPNTTVYYHFCSLDSWYDFFSWLEPDDWDYIRFWTASTDGLQINFLNILHNGQLIFSDVGMFYWLDKYHNRQFFMESRIAQFKHDRMADIVGEDYMNSILELAAQDIGFSGARKYCKYDEGQCSEFAVYAIEQATKLSSLCPDIPRTFQESNIGAEDMHDWFYSCYGGSRVLPNIRTNPDLMKPGYYLSVDSMDHSVIFVGWVGAVGGDFYVIDSNGWYNNTVALYNRSDWYDSVFATDFAGGTY